MGLFTKEELLINETLENSIKETNYTSQAEAMLYLLSGRNCFLSGPAGCGKSYVIELFSRIAEKLHKVDDTWLDDNDFTVVKTSTTGLSAINIDGITIHSFCGYFDKPYEQDKREKMKENRGFWYSKNKKIGKANIIIVDEISMLSERGFTYLVSRLKDVHGQSWKEKVQLVVCGDFTQLPPVAKSDDVEDLDTKNFCYNCQAWIDCEFTTIYLDKIFRSKDANLSTLLDNIAMGNGYNLINKEIIESIAKTEREYIKGWALLKTTNVKVDSLNEKMHNKNTNKEYINETLYGLNRKKYKYADKEDIEYADKHNIPKELKLKVGDTIMITKNNAGGHYQLRNGTIGTFIYNEDSDLWGIDVDGKEYYITDMECEELKEYYWVDETIKDIKTGESKKVKVQKDRVLATYHQYPMKLAYAITIHKSQGQTFSKVIVDIKDCWQPNLGYVALSRAESIKGLKLFGKTISNELKDYLNKNSLAVNPLSVIIKKDILNQAINLRKNNSWLTEFYNKLTECDDNIEILNYLNENK